jgi:hypothetical protein
VEWLRFLKQIERETPQELESKRQTNRILVSAHVLC